MHRSPCARRCRRSRTRACGARSLRARTLEDGTPALDTVGSASRSLIDRSRPGLRHHHAPNWRLGNCLGGFRLNRCLSGLLVHAVSRARRSRHRRSIEQRRRSLCTGSNRSRGSGWCRRRRDGNRRSGMLHTLDRCVSRCNFQRSRCRRQTVRRGMCCRRLRRCCVGRGRGSNHHGRTRDHRPHGRLARNRRRRLRRSHNLGVLSRLRHNPPRRWGCRCRSHRSARLRDCLGRRFRRTDRGWRCRRCRWTARRVARLFGGKLALKDQSGRVARLGDVGQTEGRLGLHRRLAHRRAAAALATQVVPYLFGLIGLDRAGVRLRLGDANRRQSIQDGLALDFQLPCKIVDANFAHPSLFVSPAAFNCSYQPHRRLNLVQLYS